MRMMMNLGFESDFNSAECLQKAERRIDLAIKGTARRFQAIADPFVPALTGTMARSAGFSDFGKGEIVYDTPYARHIYTAPPTTNLTKDKHPNAVVRWGDFVKERYMKELERTFQSILDGGRA